LALSFLVGIFPTFLRGDFGGDFNDAGGNLPCFAEFSLELMVLEGDGEFLFCYVESRMIFMQDVTHAALLYANSLLFELN
jgi:hypothetical protein